MTYKDELSNMPWQIIQQIKFEGMTVFITFQSGNTVQATSQCEDVLKFFKEQALRRLKPEQVIL